MADKTALPSEGDLLASKYRIQRKLGVGGMGAVFEARHEVTGRRFAIKWLLPEMATRGEGIERFVREARFAGGLEHPNVIDVYDVIEDAGAVFMVMELLEGESLADRLVRRGRLSVADTLRIALPCMRGVARAHAAGIVHRDLKPANLFICEATSELPERFKVLDFGISKIIGVPGGDDLSDSLTSSGSLMGTPFYMSPEQLRGRTVDHRADIYAFGVILYQMLSGTLPFTAGTFGDLVLQVLTETPPSLAEMAPEAPVALVQAIERAMARRPEQRYESVQQLIAALEQSVGAETSSVPARSSAPSDSLPPPQPKPAYKTRPLARSSGLNLPAPQPSAAVGTSPSGRPPVESQLTPLSTESRPPPEPSKAKQARRPRALLLAAIASAAIALLGVLAYWLAPSKEEVSPHVVQPLAEQESSVSAAAQPDEPGPSAEDETPKQQPEDHLRPWPAAESSKPEARPAPQKLQKKKSAESSVTKPKPKTEAPKIDMDPRQF
jgi:serine/threonine-protein kinase